MSPVLDAPPRRPPGLSRANGHPPPPPPRTGGDDGPGGDCPPRRPLVENAVLGAIFLIAGEVMFFAGLVSAFWVLRLGAAVWPPPLQPRLPVGLTGANTVVLLFSSAAVVAALSAHRRGLRGQALARLGVAAALGGLFLVVQGYEWVRLVHFGLTMASGAYGATFYTLIGAHAVHVLAALGWLLLARRTLARGGFDHQAGGLRACALYWHFVVALWPVLYVSVYLL